MSPRTPRRKPMLLTTCEGKGVWHLIGVNVERAGMSELRVKWGYHRISVA